MNYKEAQNTNRKGRLIIISGPSGSGKTTICNLLLEHPDVQRSVSYTTRGPRGGETDGVDYHFVKKSVFLKLIEEDKFIEHAEYCGSFYGTPIGPIEEAIRSGKYFILTIDVQGMSQIKEKISDAISIFIMVPDDETLRQRLKKRRTESESVVQNRLKIAKEELSYRKHYDFCVINDQLDNAVERIKEIINLS